MDRAYTEDGLAIDLIEMRVWRGEDGTYLILTIAMDRRLPHVGEAVTHGGKPYVVREVITSMATATFTVSCIDQASWCKRMSLPLSRPPQFTSLEEANQWLERQQ